MDVRFLVLSEPHPERPTDSKSARLAFRRWLARLEQGGQLIAFYPKVGRGAVVVLSVGGNEELHGLLTEWLDIVPGQLEVHALVDPELAAEFLT